MERHYVLVFADEVAASGALREGLEREPFTGQLDGTGPGVRAFFVTFDEPGTAEEHASRAFFKTLAAKYGGEFLGLRPAP